MISNKKIFTILFSLCLYPLFSCQTTPYNTQNQARLNTPTKSTQSNTDEYKDPFENHKLIEHIKAKTPYTGKINVKVNPGLFNRQSSSQTLHWESELNREDFKVQAVSSGPIVFRQTFIKGFGKTEQNHTFTVQQTNKRYTLHVTKSDPNLDVQIYLNGVDWSKELNIRGKEQDAQLEGLLVNASNSLNIILQGKAGATATITLIEGGEVGTLLRKHSKRDYEEENVANIFDPNNPSSLGGLTPYLGNLEFKNGVKTVSLSRTKINNQDELDFETGIFQIEFTNEESRVNFEKFYGSQIIDFTAIDGKTVYLIKADLKKSPIQNIASLLRSYNLGVPTDITSVEFSSFASLQTFTIVLDTLINHPEWVKGIGLNIAGKGNSEEPVTSEWFYNPFLPDPNHPNIEDGWLLSVFDAKMYNSQIPRFSSPKPIQNRIYGHFNWGMADSYVPNAWNYSIGTGVKVAWLDENVVSDHPELNRRYIFNEHNPPNRICNLCWLFSPNKEGQINHGHYSMMVGFAERDNGIFATGVAPNAQVMPFSNVVLHWDMVKALQLIREKNLDVDIVGTSVGWPMWGYMATLGLESLSDGTIIKIASFGRSLGLEYELISLAKREIPFVCAAMNDRRKNEPGFFDVGYAYIPSLKLPGVISVSNAEKQSVSPLVDPYIYSKDLFPVKDGYNPGIGFNKAIVSNNYWSNYDQSGISFWAPGSSLPTAHSGSIGFKPNKLALNIPEHFSGTSAASPFMAGVIALMKSRNPSLKIAEIKQILEQTGRPLDEVKYGITDLQVSNTRFVNALEAVKSAIRKKDPNIVYHQAQTYFGLVTPSKTIKLIASVMPKAAQELKEKQLIQSVSNEVWNSDLNPGEFVKILGWSSVNTGKSSLNSTQLEVLKASRICTIDATGCKNFSSIPFNPFINEIIYPPNASASTGFELELKGSNLISDLRGQAGIVPFKLAFQAIRSLTTSTLMPIIPDINIEPSDILDIHNDGTYIKVKIKPNIIQAGFEYQIAYRSSITGDSNLCSKYVQSTTGSSSPAFSVKATGSSDGFSVLSKTLPYNAEESGVNIFKWVLQDTRQLPVIPESYIGIGINAQQLGIFEVTVDGKPMKIVDVADQYLSGTLPNDLEPGVKDLLIKYAGGDLTLPKALEVFARPKLSLTQSVPTVGGVDVNSFPLNGQNYLSFTNHHDGTSSHQTMELMRWNGSLFEPFQSFPTISGRDATYFTMGNDSYMAIANYYSTIYRTTSLNSQLYRWDGTQFVLHQNIPTRGAVHFEHFTIDGQDWLAVANSYEANPITTSTLYRWNGSQFISVQEIPTMGAVDWSHIQIENNHYLVVANSRSTDCGGTCGNGNLISVMYKWNGSSFEHFQDFATQGGSDWEPFKIGNQQYLAVANYDAGPNQVTYSRIYRWNGTQFVTHQSLPSPFARVWKHFEHQNEDYLISANNDNTSRLYHWDGREFQLREIIDTTGGGYDWEFFQIGERSFLALAKYYGTTGYRGNSEIYHFN